MASPRYLFGRGVSDFAIAPPSRHGGFVVSAPSLGNGTLWSQEVGGTQYTDLETVNGGATTVVSTDVDGALVPFYGPAGIDEAWLDFGGGSRCLITASVGQDAHVGSLVGDSASASRVALNATFPQKSTGTIHAGDYALIGDGVADDTAPLQSLLTAANGKVITADGTYKVTSNLTGVHSARYRGAGRIVRDAVTFYLNPTGSQTNTIYVNPAGNDANDGLTPALPKATLQAAFDLLTNYGPVLAGKWVIQLAAGTHTLTATASLAIQSLNRVTIQGPAVTYGVPTAIVTGNNSASVVIGVLLTGCFARVADVKFTNFNPGDATGTGFQAQDFSDVWLDNVHADGCSFIGAYVMSNSKLRLTGGIYENCQRAVRVYANTSYSVGYNSSAHRPIFRNCTIGFEARDMSAGRLDYTDISNCELGAWAYQGARLHPVSCTFTSCTKAGIYVSAGGQWYNDPDFPSTFTTNNVDVSTGSASSETAWSQGPSEVYLGATKAPATLTGTTTQTTIATLASVPQKAMNEAGSQLIFRVSGVFSGTGDKSVTIRVNGTSIGTYTASTGSLKTFTLEVRMLATAGNAQSIIWRGLENAITNPFVFKANTTIPFSPNLLASVVVQGTLTNTAGSIEITQASYSYVPVSHLW